MYYLDKKTTVPPPGDGWQPIATGPKTGPVIHVEGWNGVEVKEVHYAYGGGDEQPAFGPAWFFAVKDCDNRIVFFSSMEPQPTHWRPLCPTAPPSPSTSTT